MDSAVWSLVRDPSGRANWQFADPDAKGRQGAAAHPQPVDAERSGHSRRRPQTHPVRRCGFPRRTAPAGGGIRPLHIEGSGHLNGRANTFAINGDPLATASHDRAYRFTFAERSSGSYLKVALPCATLLHASSRDHLRGNGRRHEGPVFPDGFNLPDTATYHLSGKLVRREMHFPVRPAGDLGRERHVWRSGRRRSDRRQIEN